MMTLKNRKKGPDQTVLIYRLVWVCFSVHMYDVISSFRDSTVTALSVCTSFNTSNSTFSSMFWLLLVTSLDPKYLVKMVNIAMISCEPSVFAPSDQGIHCLTLIQWYLDIRTDS